MSGTAPRRQRIVRVRRVQHLQASVAASAAADKLGQLEMSAERLVDLRSGLMEPTGGTSGAALAHRHELAGRLDQARHGLTDAIASARTVAAAKAEARLEARRHQESAEKLEARAASVDARLAELRRMGQARPRIRRGLAEETTA